MEELSYIHTPATYKYDFWTIPDRLAFQARTNGDKEVYVFLHPDGRRMSTTAKALHEKSTRLASRLIKLGIRKGDRVVLCFPNDLEGLQCLFGVIYAGAIVINVISAKEDGSDVKVILSKVGAKALIINPGESQATFKACMNYIDIFDGEGNASSNEIPSLKYFLTSTAVAGQNVFTLQQLLGQDLATESPLPRLDPSDISHMFLTSGSTGEPKFVPVSHFTTMIIGHQVKDSIGYDVDDKIYTERRFAWIGGFPFMLLQDGMTVVTKTAAIPSIAEHCRFTLDAITKENCTIAGLFPLTIIGLNDISANNRVSPLLKAIQTGGLPVTTVCYAGIGKLASRISNCYGSSEAGAVTTLDVFSETGNVDYNTGPPVPGVEVKVVNSDGFVVKRGEPGAIYVRSPSLLNGYYCDESKTSEVLSVSRWFNTDDTGYVDVSGNLVVTGRQSDIILQGGKNYVAGEVEGIVKTHPAVADAVVVPVPDATFFQLVCVCVIAKPGSQLTGEQLKAFYKSIYLPSAGEAFRFIPKMFLVFDEFPRLYTGKPNKKQLIEEAIERKQLDSELL